MKNEPVMEIANQFMNDCNNFEIRDLDNNRGRVDDLPEIELCSNYIKAHIKGEKNQFKKHIIETGNEKIDEIGFLEKGSFKLFYTKDENLQVQRITNNIILEAVGNSKRVMSLSTCLSFAVGQYQSTMMRKLGEEDVADWFDDKKLYFYECVSDDNLIDLAEKLRARIIDLNIDVLYIPHLEDLLQNYCADLQISTLKHLYNFAFDTNICIVSTLASLDYYGWKNETRLFYPQHKLDIKVLKKNLPPEALYITSFANNIASFDNWSVWDNINDTPSKVSVQSFDDFYTFDSISIKPRLV